MDSRVLNNLFKKYKDTGDIGIRNQIVEDNYKLAQSIASHFMGKGIDYDDLLQVALVALVGAVERFNPDFGFKFSTFATPTIIGEIKNYFRDNVRPFHLSRRDSEALMAFSEIKEALEKEGKFTVTDIAERMNVDEERVLQLIEMQKASSVSSLETILSADNKDFTIADLLGEDEKGYSEIDTEILLEKLLSSLDEREQAIFTGRFLEKKSQYEIATALGVSQMYVSRAERRLIAKLKLLLN